MADQFENWLKKSTPDVPDSEVDRSIQRAILSERIRAMQLRRAKMRRRLGVYSAVMVLVLMVSWEVVDVGSDGFDVTLVKTVELPSADGEVREHKVFESEFTGQHIGSESGTAEDARKTMEIALGGVSAPHSVIRWGYAGGWRWTMLYYDPERNTWVSTDPSDVEDNSNEAFSKFLAYESAKYMQMLERGEGNKVGTFVKPIEGIEYNFTKWEFLTPDSLVVEIWEGVPVR